MTGHDRDTRDEFAREAMGAFVTGDWYMKLDETDSGDIMAASLEENTRGYIFRYSTDDMVTPARSVKVIINGSDS